MVKSNLELVRWKKISSKECCENQWISVREDKVKLPNGEILESYIVIEYCGAVGVLAVENNKILLVKQYRYDIDEFTWEIPAGNLISPEQIIKSAKTELMEEAGYEADEVAPFYHYHPSPGSSTEVIHLVLAKHLHKVSDLVNHESFFETSWLDIDVVLGKISQGEITHSPTVIGLLLAREQGLL